MKIKFLILVSFLIISTTNAQNYLQTLKDFDNLTLDGGNYILKKGNGQISYTPNDNYIISYNYDSITKTLNIKVRAKEKLKFKKDSAPLIELTTPSIKICNPLGFLKFILIVSVVGVFNTPFWLIATLTPLPESVVLPQ